MPRQKKQHLKRRKDGRFACRYKDQWFMGATEDEALAAREEYKQQERAGLQAKCPTVGEYILKWLPLHKRSVSVKCYNDYAVQLEALLPVIGNKPLSDVTVDDAASVWAHYDGYSASTIHRAKMLYIALFDTALENDLCRKNPFRSKHAQPPQASDGTHRVITQEEIRLIHTTPHRMQLAAMIMLYAGLRRGEVLALTDRDIDMNAGIIRVNKAVRFLGNQPETVTPKTAAGIRRVPILSPLMPYLTNLPRYAASKADGEPMTEIAFRRGWASYMVHLSRAAGHPVIIRPHDLRHTYCTMLRDAGVDMKQSMIWMGHADEKMILRVYDHAGEARAQTSLNQVEKMLIGRQNGRQSDSVSAETVDI